MDHSIENLQKKFASAASVRFKTGAGNFTYIEIDNAFATAEISLHGAHLTHFAPRNRRPVIWMSGKSWFEPEKPIRGGVPICWPWFGAANDPALPAHGFARISDWNIVAAEELPDGTTRVALELQPADVDPRFTPFPFALKMEFVVGAALEMKLTMTNLSNRNQTISDALHSYFAVADSTKIRLRGLDKVEYSDRVVGAPQVDGLVQSGDIVIDREVDRVYLDTVAAVEIVDPGYRRTIRIEKSGSRTTVVWNPWIAKSQRMPDFGDEEYKTMVCVEATNNLRDTLNLPPVKTHLITQKISVIEDK